jgi:hypothetical protein
MIPTHLHADLSPLLVRAGEWPDARALSPVPPWVPPDAKDEVERRAGARPVPPDLQPELDRLLATVEQLVHPDLCAGPLARRLYWTADRALYHRLRSARDRDDERASGRLAGERATGRLAAEGASASGRLPATRPTTGWASFAPTAGQKVQAFCLYGHRRRLDAATDAPAALLELLRELLAPALMDELATIRPHPAPAVQGPADHAAIFRLSPAGFGLAYSYLYAYTNGERVVAAVQPLVHHTL